MEKFLNMIANNEHRLLGILLIVVGYLSTRIGNDWTAAIVIIGMGLVLLLKKGNR